MRSKKFYTILVFGIFLGVVLMLVLTSNVDLTLSGVAADRPETLVALGSPDPVPQDLVQAHNLSNAFIKVAKIASPAVVTINSETVVKQRFSHPFLDDPFFRRFFDVPEESQEQIRRGLGSGVIVNPDGYVLTNNHVVSEADEITVTFGEEEYDAEVVGRDPESDVAVIKIEKNNLPTIKLGDSDKLEVGEWVLAIGNPFSDQLQKSVTAGIVSAKGRSLGNIQGARLTYQDFIQTDAAINPGNSGGALVNLRGELVGINTAIIGQTNVGIGFAIPINLAKNVMQQLIKKGRVVRGWLGVLIGPVDEDMARALDLEEAKGALVNDVVKDSPAEKAGLKPADVIFSVDGKSVSTPDELTNMIGNISPDAKVSVKVYRDGKVKEISVTLGERPRPEEVANERKQDDTSERLGLDVQELTDRLARRLGYENESGVVVSGVKRNSPAYREGIREGDLITSVNRKSVSSVREYNAEISKLGGDDIVFLRIKRGENNLFVALRVPKDK